MLVKTAVQKLLVKGLLRRAGRATGRPPGQGWDVRPSGGAKQVARRSRQARQANR